MYKISKLKNGITLITAPVKGTKATTVLAMFPIGSRYEEKNLCGGSHFVEHLMFKGTSKRPTALDISQVLEKVGADYNAFTNKDYTGYYVKIDGSKQELAFDLLSDMIYNSKMDETEMEKEKGPIVEELRMYQDNPTMAIDMLFDHVMFGESHPLGKDIGGTEQSVKSMKRADLWKYYQTHYSPKNMALLVTGKIDAKLKNYLKYFSAQLAPAAAKGPEYYKKEFTHYIWPKQPPSLAERVAVEERKADQAHIIIGFPGINNNHPDRFAAAILLTILGAGMSSRLFIEVREKRGLAYMVRSASETFRDVGAFYVQAGLDPARLKEAISVIRAELERIAREPVTINELKDSKTSIAGRLALSMEDSSSQAEWYAKQFLFADKILTAEQWLKKLNVVTVKDVQRVAEKYFKWNEARVAVIGAIPKASILKMVE